MSPLWNLVLRTFANRKINTRQHSFRPSLEALEDRLALSWAGVPPATIAPPSSSVAVTLNSSGDAQGTAAISSTEVDYFRFTAATTGSYRLAATTPSSTLDPVLGIFNASGQRLAYNDDISSSNTDSQLTVNLQAGVRYYFGVTNYTGTRGGSYSWLVDGPSSVTDDAYEENDSRTAAYSLGTLSAVRTLTGLKMRDREDWFRYDGGLGGNSDYVSISFSHAEGDLDLFLYNSQGTLVRSSEGTTNSERISLSGLAGGTYYVRVLGYNGAQSSNYSLTIDPGNETPPPPPPTGGNHVLYINFDGVTISRTDLVRYAGTDWSANDLDPERDGIRVSAYLSGRSDREQIIGQALAYVQADLNTFGVTVQRRTGLAVENQGATTIFVGQDNIRGDFGGLACDIDYGNNNRTDIAFVRPYSSSLTLADIILHEAGHTFGLYHVNSPSTPEAMGNGYSSGTYAGMNVSFMNQSFAEYVDQYGYYHGDGRGPQNSYQVIYSTFVTGTATAGTGGSAAAQQAMHWDTNDGAVYFGHGHDHDGHHLSHAHESPAPVVEHHSDLSELASMLAAIQADDRRRSGFAADAFFSRG